MQIGIIGAGKVGCSIGKYLVESLVPVTGYYSRTIKSAVEAAEFTGSKMFDSIEELVSVSDTLFITTPDDSIAGVWDCIAKLSVKDKIICHFSGSLSSVVFSGIDVTGASCCSIHPMLAFSDRFSSYIQLNQAYMTIEGQDYAVSVIKKLFENAGNKVFQIDSCEKSRYHAAASVLSNQMIALFQTGIDMLKQCGFKEEDAISLVTPLVRNNTEAFLSKGSVNALTGPVERGDSSTVRKHLDVLEGDDREIYRLLAAKLVTIAKEKNPSRDYEELTTILNRERNMTK